MKYFDNLKKINNNDIKFNLNNNNVKIAFANALRRICIGDIITPVIDESNVNIINNTSYLNNGIISNRISLIPLIGNNEYDNIKVILRKNNTSDNIINVYASDLQFFKDNKEEKQDKYIIHPKILITHLKKNEEIYLEGTVSFNSLNHGGACYSPVSTISYYFKKDEDKIKKELSTITDPLKKKDFELLDAYRHYKKNDLDEPVTYCFTLESNGTYNPKNIIEHVFKYLKDKLINIKKSLDENDTEKIKVERADYNIETYDFVIYNEDDTLGNLLNSYLIEDSNIKFVGYDIPHPLDKILIIRQGLINNNSIENNINLFKKYIDIIINIIDNMDKEWKTFI